MRQTKTVWLVRWRRKRGGRFQTRGVYGVYGDEDAAKEQARELNRKFGRGANAQEYHAEEWSVCMRKSRDEMIAERLARLIVKHPETHARAMRIIETHRVNEESTLQTEVPHGT